MEKFGKKENVKDFWKVFCKYEDFFRNSHHLGTDMKSSCVKAGRDLGNRPGETKGLATVTKLLNGRRSTLAPESGGMVIGRRLGMMFQ